MIGATAIILAGGKGKRLGMNKPFIRVGKFYLIEIVFMKLKELFPEIIIVTSEENYLNLSELWKGPIRPAIVKDDIPEKGPLGGLYTGLLLIKNHYAFVCACDMPFLNPNLIKYMFRHRYIENPKSQISICHAPSGHMVDWRTKQILKHKFQFPKTSFDYDAIVPELSPGKFEMLHSFYSKNCLDVIQKNLKNNELSLRQVLPHLKVYYVPPEKIKKFDPEFESFININTQQDLKRLQNGILH